MIFKDDRYAPGATLVFHASRGSRKVQATGKPVSVSLGVDSHRFGNVRRSTQHPSTSARRHRGRNPAGQYGRRYGARQRGGEGGRGGGDRSGGCVDRHLLVLSRRRAWRASSSTRSTSSSSTPCRRSSVRAHLPSRPILRVFLRQFARSRPSDRSPPPQSLQQTRCPTSRSSRSSSTCREKRRR